MSSPLIPSSPPVDPHTAGLIRLFHYLPNQDVAIFACVFFAVIAIIVAALTIYFKGHFMWIIAVTLAIESLGYGLRILVIHHYTLITYIVSTLMLICAPVALAFVNYYVLGIILKQYGSKAFCLKPQWIAWLFLGSDILTFFIQASSSGLLTQSKPSMVSAGRAVMVFGLVLQLVFFAIFTWITLHVAFISPRFKLYRVRSVRSAFHGLWFTIGCLFIRNIYRTLEYSVKQKSYIVTHEWTFYAFEMSAIAICGVFYCVYHFGRVLPDKGSWKLDFKAHKDAIQGDANSFAL
jgi:hypothetical protein